MRPALISSADASASTSWRGHGRFDGAAADQPRRPPHSQPLLLKELGEGVASVTRFGANSDLVVRGRDEKKTDSWGKNDAASVAGTPL